MKGVTALAIRQLNALGYEFPFKTTESKNFAGLGSKGSRTEGFRRMPFSLKFESSGDVLNGVIESHQLAEGDTPMLLSLHAQAALRIVKNMRTCEISSDGKPLEWFRCSRTRLLMLNLTQGLRDANQESLDNPVHKCHRQYRALTGFTVDGPAPMLPGRKWMSNEFGTRFGSPSSAQEYFEGVLSSSTQVILVTTGERFEHFTGGVRPRAYKHFNCKVLHNAEHDPADRDHLGWNPKLLQGIIRSDGFSNLKDQVLQSVGSASSAGVVLNLSCTQTVIEALDLGSRCSTC